MASVAGGGGGSRLVDGTVVVVGGRVTCVGNASQCAAALRHVPSESVIHTDGGHLWAGMISVGDGIGLYEMGEAATHDGSVTRGSESDLLNLHAADGMRSGGRHMWEAWRGGLALSVTPPEGSGGSDHLVRGWSGAMWTTPDHDFAGDHGSVMFARDVALHITLGNSVKGRFNVGGIGSSISGQIALLRQLISPASAPPEMAPILAGNATLVVHANQADTIAKVLRLKSELAPRLRLTIFGGAEAHLLATQLAAAAVPVILSPPRAVPRQRFDQDRAVYLGETDLLDSHGSRS
jgi:hypothetical protein